MNTYLARLVELLESNNIHTVPIKTIPQLLDLLFLKTLKDTISEALRNPTLLTALRNTLLGIDIATTILDSKTYTRKFIAKLTEVVSSTTFDSNIVKVLHQAGWDTEKATEMIIATKSYKDKRYVIKKYIEPTINAYTKLKHLQEEIEKTIDILLRNLRGEKHECEVRAQI